jgi:hypothetical protein
MNSRVMVDHQSKISAMFRVYWRTEFNKQIEEIQSRPTFAPENEHLVYLSTGPFRDEWKRLNFGEWGNVNIMYETMFDTVDKLTHELSVESPEWDFKRADDPWVDALIINWTKKVK